jgi:V8-like Glu-specific endopeptidase
MKLAAARDGRVTAVAVVALVVTTLAGGCGSDSGASPPPDPVASASAGSPATAAEGGAADASLDYWTRARLLAAQPWRLSAVPPAPGLPLARPTAHAVRLAAPRVGALFETDVTGNHFCTASVVASPGRDLLITAAHCVNDGKGHDKQDIVFAPGYADGSTPYGVWTPRAVIVDQHWANGADPAYDVGFVVLSAQGTREIQDILGANQIAFGTGPRQFVRVTGYPSSADAPVTCLNWTSQDAEQHPRFECGGFYGGTSGSPWVANFNPVTRTGAIVGVIGGYQQGGTTDVVSYSSYLGPEIERLYAQAEAAG